MVNLEQVTPLEESAKDKLIDFNAKGDYPLFT
jgi:hypothetical protein